MHSLSATEFVVGAHLIPSASIIFESKSCPSVCECSQVTRNLRREQPDSARYFSCFRRSLALPRLLAGADQASAREPGLALRPVLPALRSVNCLEILPSRCP